MEATAFEFGPLQTKWLEALESGNYVQGQGNLRQPVAPSSENVSGQAYCCLGVLCEVAGLKWVDERTQCLCGNPDCKTGSLGYEHGDQVQNGDLPGDFYEAVGLFDSSGIFGEDFRFANECGLIALNDVAGLTFPQIAQVIRDNPTKVFTKSA